MPLIPRGFLAQVRPTAVDASPPWWERNTLPIGEWSAAPDPLRPQGFAPPTDGIAANGLPIFSWDQAAAQITRDNVSWNVVRGTAVTVSYAFRSTAPAIMPDDTAGFTRFSETQILVAEEALALWSDVANITFQRVGAGSSGEGAYSNNASILFSNYATGAEGASAFAFYPSPFSTGAGAAAGDVWVNFSIADNSNPVFGEFGPHVLAHEIGHAIGLSHPGDYNAGPGLTITYETDAVYWQDARMFTIMSYFGSTNTGGSLGAFSAGPQLHDIAAAQLLYGANATTRTGDTVYGFNANTGHQHTTIVSGTLAAVFAIWDAGGNDTLDLSGYATASEIDLREEAFSSAGPATNTPIAVGNIAIARGAVIENAIGGAGNDTIIGNAVNNRLVGGGGADSIDGGGGIDTVDYAASASGVSVNLASGVGSGGDAQGDTLALIENLIGSALVDALTGSTGANILNGGGGDDTLLGGDGDDVLVGSAGADTLGGGAGSDTADYATSVSGVTIDLFSGTGLGGDALGDVLASIEIVVGSSVNDVLSGRDFVTDTLNGGDGDDVLMGRYGGDVLNGGNGVDTLSYANSLTGVDVRLFSGLALGGEANGDVYSSIENIIGTATRTDTLAGNDNANLIWGGGGNETITGRGGGDHLFGEAGNDTLLGGAADDVLVGGAGNDTLGGGVGADTADYSASAAGVTINLQAGTGAGGDAAGDALVSIENVIGSAQADTIAGKNNFDNVLDGGADADTLSGGTGNDTFVFRAGQAGGDSVLDFSSAGVGDNDSFLFLGYGTAAAGATFVQLDAVHWQINSADGTIHDTITLANSATVNPGDFIFG